MATFNVGGKSTLTTINPLNLSGASLVTFSTVDVEAPEAAHVDATSVAFTQSYSVKLTKTHGVAHSIGFQSGGFALVY